MRLEKSVADERKFSGACLNLYLYQLIDKGGDNERRHCDNNVDSSKKK